MSTSPPRVGQRRGAGMGALLGASALAGVVAIGAAQLGTIALYAVVASLAAGVALWVVRDQVGPPLADAVDRIRPAHHPVRRLRSRVARGALGVAAVVTAAGCGWVVAQQGTKAIALLAATAVGAVVVWLLFPLLRDLVTTPPTDVPAREAAPTPWFATPASRPARLVGSLLAVGGAGMLAWVAAQLGLKGLLALVGGLLLVALLGVVRDRSVFFTFVAVSSLTFVLHKSFGPQDLELSGGAISVYVTTFDAVLLLLYGIWLREGTFVADVRSAWRERPILRLPLWGALALLPSLLVAQSPMHGIAELVRMAWMYLLFVYIAVRVRTRRHVWAVLGGLAVFAVVELVVVVLQWRTGGVLGLSFLGVPTQLGERVTDSSVVGRPFGTIIHPVFMGAVMGALALVALGVALTRRRSLVTTSALTLVGVCLVPLYLAHTRASLVAVGLVALGLVGVALHRRDLRWSTVGRAALVGLGAAALLSPSLITKVSQNFGTGHFFEEVRSRQELNVVAWEMFGDHPLVGVGLNNFEQVMGPYERTGLIFFDNPVHNLYLLYLSETGVIGLAGVLAVGIGMLAVAWRLARARDRLFRGVGLGITGAMVFLAIEELLGFSLRQDIPLALYWLLAGLAVACAHQAGLRRREPQSASGGADEGLDAELARLVAELRAVNGPDPDHVAELEARVHDLVEARRAQLLVARAAPGASRAATGEIDAELAWLDELAGMSPTASSPTGRIGARPRRVRPGAVLGAVLLVAALLPALAAPGRALPTAGLRITFSATERATGIGGIYVADGDGTGITRITPADGRVYSWPQWALGGTHIVFTTRTGTEGAPEDLRIMRADGSDERLISHFDYRVGQPKIDPTGRWLVFTAQVPWFPVVALFRMDLATLESTNLSAVTAPDGAIDADPMLTPGGEVVYAQSDLEHTQVALMAADGTNRRLVTNDDYFNTDPDVSPDGTEVAIASYRGAGSPGVPGRVSLVGVRPEDWHLVVRDLRTGDERVLTEGQRCIERSPDDPCTPDQTSAFKPRYTPDGSTIGFNGALDDVHTCICLIGRDGSDPRVLIARGDLALDWFDWVVPTGTPTGAPVIGSRARSSKLLVTRAEAGGPAQLVAASPDLMHRVVLPLPHGLQPGAARWTPAHDRVVFTAHVPVDRSRAVPHPAPPPGASRREHVTLDSLDPVALASSATRVPADAASEQVFLREPDGTVRQLTDPWLEDWRDGVAAGDARANTDPVLSADGSTVIVTNTSTLTGESFLLRIDLATGDVLNLTNGTSGALPVEDGKAQLSPDGGTVVFVWTEQGRSDVFTMRADDGTGLVRVSDDAWVDTAPTFTPDGRAVVYASYRGAGVPVAVGDDGLPVAATDGWVLVHVDLATGAQTVRTAPADSPTWNPTVAPEGDRIAFVSTRGRSLDVHVVGASAGDARPLQPDPHADELFVDWR